jgi:protein-S-isoprenylcysteine O-methyltransferase Ste14
VDPFTNTFFWAFLAMACLLGASALVGSRPRTPFIGVLVVIVIEASRLLAVLPVCPQPRFEAGAWRWVASGLVLAVSAVFALPSFQIRPFTAPQEHTRLRTSGLYAVVRHPIYLADVLWPLGAALAFRSTYGVALVPVWWFGFEILALAEERSLGRVLGERYAAYKRSVRWRIVPGLPF